MTDGGRDRQCRCGDELTGNVVPVVHDVVDPERRARGMIQVPDAECLSCGSSVVAMYGFDALEAAVGESPDSLDGWEVLEGDVVTVRDEDRRGDPGPWKVEEIVNGEARLWAATEPMRYEPVSDLNVVTLAEDTTLPHGVPGDDDDDDDGERVMTDGCGWGPEQVYVDGPSVDEDVVEQNVERPIDPRPCAGDLTGHPDSRWVHVCDGTDRLSAVESSSCWLCSPDTSVDIDALGIIDVSDPQSHGQLISLDARHCRDDVEPGDVVEFDDKLVQVDKVTEWGVVVTTKLDQHPMFGWDVDVLGSLVEDDDVEGNGGDGR